MVPIPSVASTVIAVDPVGGVVVRRWFLDEVPWTGIWQFVELLHPAFTRRQQFFWGGLKNHKRPKNQGIVRTASDEPGHEGVRVLGSFAHGHAA